MWTKTEGTLYEQTRSLDIREIASLIRSEIRLSAKQGRIPSDWKYSVRLRRFAGGQAIDVEIHVPKAVSELRWNAPFYSDDPRNRADMIGEFEPLGRLFDAQIIIQEITDAYNYYSAHAYEDGCSVRFFSHIQTYTMEEKG